MMVLATQASTCTPLHHRQSLFVSIASSEEDINQCLTLRHRVFACELGAQLESRHAGLDYDYFDAYARHLMVKDTRTGRVIATSRLLSSKTARLSGSFYSETEFDLHKVLSLNANYLEVGRTCVMESYRNSAALSLLWRGIVRIAVIDDVDYLIGCVSMPLGPSFTYAHSIMNLLREQYYSCDTLRVYPHYPLPELQAQIMKDVIMPTLLKGYLRLGAKVCGEACYDKNFNVADVFILLQRESLEKKFSRHLSNKVIFK